MNSVRQDEASLDNAPGIAQAIAILRERVWVIILCGVVAALAAFVYAERKPNQYTATSSLQFTTNSLPSQVAGGGTGQTLDPEGEKSTNVQLVTTTAVADGVVKSLGLMMTPAEALSGISASTPQNDYVVDITATNENPVLAAKLANAFANQYVIYSQQQNEQQLIRGQALIAEKEAKLPAGDTTDRANLAALSQKLLLLQAVASSNARVVGKASPPTSPSSPNRKAITIVALIFGLLLGVGIAVLMHVMSRRVRTIDEFESLFGLRAVAAVPQLTGQHHSAEQREYELEPFRMLQNSLPLLNRDRQVKTVLVTSSVPGEGKTTVAISLARAVAMAGESVVLVEADLRRPTVDERLRVDGSAGGLAAALFDRADPLELVQSPEPDLPGLHVLPAGPVEAEAAARLRPFDLTRAFDALASQFDLIVIDTAPLLPVADTRVLLDELPIDVFLLVARAGVTTREEIKETRSLIEQRGIRRNAALVINALAERNRDYYYRNERPEPSVVAESPSELVIRR